MAQQNSCVSVDSRLFERVLESLCDERSTFADSGVEELSHHEERQQALLELLSARALNHFDESRLLSLSNAAKFYRVSEMIYQRQREFGGIVDCYCLDQARRNLVFAYIKQTIASPDISAEEKGRLRKAVLARLEELICIDAEKATKLVATNLGVDLAQAVNEIVRCRNDDAAFDFLRCLFAMMNSCNGGPTDNDDWQFDPSVYERYVDLLCQRSMVEAVTEFVRSHDGYRAGKMLDICRRFHVSDAVVVLLEKSGDVSGAFEEAIRDLRTKLSAIVRFEDRGPSQLDRLRAVRDRVDGVVSLVNRNSQQLDRLRLRQSWFVLFDLLVEHYNRLIGCRSESIRVDGSGGGNCGQVAEGGSTSDRGAYRSILQHAVSCTVSSVPFAAVLEHLVALGEQDGIASCFGNVRDLLTGVVDACRYQQTLYATCARIVQKDVNSAVGGLTAAARSPTSPLSDTCSACHRPLNETTNKTDQLRIVCFRCGHAFHDPCLADSVGVGDSDAEDCRSRRPYCTVCCRSRTRSASLPYDRSRVVEAAGPAATEQEQLPTCWEAVDQLRRSQRTASRLEVLAELAQLDQTKPARSASKVWNGRGSLLAGGGGGAFRRDVFALKLAPPPAR